jgi:hypothetical protein
MTNAPTLADLQEAQVDLERQRERRDNYTGNNPNKYVTEVRLAQETVSTLTQALKASGLLARTDHEILEAKLDAAHPKARPKDIVTFENERFQRWMTPATRSLSGGVATWDKGWTKITTGSARADDH